MQYRIVFLDGAWMDFIPPAEFHLPTLVTTCRSMGYFLTNEMYVRFDLVRCILAWQGDQPPAMPQNAPSTVKMQ